MKMTLADITRKRFTKPYRKGFNLIMDARMTPEQVEVYYVTIRGVTKRFGEVIARRLREAPNSKVRRTIREAAMKSLERAS